MFWTTLFITDAKSDAECSPLILPVTCISNKGSRRYQTSPMLAVQPPSVWPIGRIDSAQKFFRSLEKFAVSE